MINTCVKLQKYEDNSLKTFLKKVIQNILEKFLKKKRKTDGGESKNIEGASSKISNLVG